VHPPELTTHVKPAFPSLFPSVPSPIMNLARLFSLLLAPFTKCSALSGPSSPFGITRSADPTLLIPRNRSPLSVPPQEEGPPSAVHSLQSVLSPFPGGIWRRMRSRFSEATYLGSVTVHARWEILNFYFPLPLLPCNGYGLRAQGLSYIDPLPPKCPPLHYCSSDCWNFRGKVVPRSVLFSQLRVIGRSQLL